MSKAYICSVSKRLSENYELGLRMGVWGVEERYHERIDPVQPGDLLIFVVDGCFRSIHPVLSGVYRDSTLVWPLKDGDPFPYRVQIGPAAVAGSAKVADIAPRISFMSGKQWGGTLRGRNGVFNSAATPTDVELIMAVLQAMPAPREDPPVVPPSVPQVVPVPPTYWLPGFLDRLAALAELRSTRKFTDPFAGADVWQRGLLTGVYADRRETPTIAVSPIDRSPAETVLSTLYGLSSVKQSAEKVSEVRGVIFVHERQDEIVRLVHGLPNVTALSFDVHVSLPGDP